MPIMLSTGSSGLQASDMNDGGMPCEPSKDDTMDGIRLDAEVLIPCMLADS